MRAYTDQSSPSLSELDLDFSALSLHSPRRDTFDRRQKGLETLVSTSTLGVSEQDDNTMSAYIKYEYDTPESLRKSVFCLDIVLVC